MHLASGWKIRHFLSGILDERSDNKRPIFNIGPIENLVVLLENADILLVQYITKNIKCFKRKE